MRDAHWRSGAYAAEFTGEREFVGALAALRDRGYEQIETYTPYHVEAADAVLREPPGVLPLVVFGGGLAGGAIGYWVQWYADAVSYPLNIGGHPAHATPAFFIPTFESTVLAAALTAFVGLFYILRLPRPWHPMFEVDGFERASVDRFWIAIDATDHRADPMLTPRDLEAVRAARVVRVPADA